MSYSIGVDIGGTFTDVVLIEGSGRVHVAKGISTVRAYEQGIFAMVRRLLGKIGLEAADCGAVVHGTTVATNAIIERKGARTGLITTRGFRDVLELRRIRIPKLYDLEWEKPEPLVPRFLRVEVGERMTHKGEVFSPLEKDSVREALKALRSHGVESVAVSLINSYANPAHEEAVRDILKQAAPELHVTLSSEVLPEMREYERTSTTVINAYVMPVVKRYVASLEGGLRGAGFKVPLLLMQSNGGTMSAELACETPIHVVESGPAAGVIAAHHLAARARIRNAVALDIGGTTAKASLIEDGQVTYAKEYEVGAGFTRTGRMSRGGGYVLRAPTIDIAEIGAGGGSLVWVDGGGALRVGPKSAGASPGPACYGLDGTEPTLTDACAVLGYLDPQGLAGGEVALDLEKAQKALQPVADRLVMKIDDLAHGVYRIAVSNMCRAIRAISTERGKDPRDFDLIAFGGNGPLFAAAVARELELPRVIIPPAAGIFSAFGLLYSDLEHHFTQTLLGRLDQTDPAHAEALWRRLEAEALCALEREGYGRERAKLQRFSELRYLSQSHELSVPWQPTLEALAERFEEEHERTYGHRGHDGVVELVNLHLVASGSRDQPRVPQALEYRGRLSRKPAQRKAYFDGRWHDARILTRDSVDKLDGPAVIHEFDTTVLVPPGFSAATDSNSNLVLTPA
ncbi:MAG: hydantoinase/oxoprolinase family protein [Alphaproteobacteria bacterium]|nr:hydantoinase/oxoprolinase family protein [Alphaproteobacteria bacterium]